MGTDLSSALPALVASRAGPLGRRVAFAGARGTVTFAELHARADALARDLAALSIGEDDVVGVSLSGGADLAAAFLAALRLRACTALLPPNCGRDAMRSVAAELKPRCIVASAAQAAAVAEATHAGRVEAVGGVALAAILLPAAVSPASGRALVKLTSGSTGAMKGVGLGAENVAAEARNLAAALALAPGDRILAPVPLCHSYGFDLGILASLWTGATLVMPEGLVPRRLLRDLAESTILLGVPALYRLLLELRCDPPDLSRVRYLLSCTAPLAPHAVEAFHARYGAPICQHYGSSETGGVTLHDPAHALSRPASVGRALPGVVLEVVDGDGCEVPCGGAGEIVVRGAAVSSGYVTGAPARSGLRDGAYFTGDLGSLDEAGFLRVEGRLDRMINVGGLKVSPDEVAHALELHGAVREAAVMGVDAGGGEQAVCAAVTLKGPADEAELLRFLRARLPDYKVPRRIDVLAEMPRTPSGKILLRNRRIGA